MTKSQREIGEVLYTIPALRWHLDIGDKPSFLAKKMFFAIERYVKILREGSLRGNPLNLFPVISGLSDAWLPTSVLEKWKQLDSENASHVEVADMLEGSLL